MSATWSTFAKNAGIITGVVAPLCLKSAGAPVAGRAVADKKADVPYASMVPNYINNDGETFTLPKGKTLSHVVEEHNRFFPHAKITWQELSRANGDLAPEKFQAGKPYKLPYTPFSRGFMYVLEALLAEGKRRGLEIPQTNSVMPQVKGM